MAERIDALGGVVAALRHIWPELSDAEMLVRGSSSNGVYADGIEPQASSGLHVYVLIKDPANSVKALDALQRRAWAAGLGWIKPSASGSALVRSIIDTSVGTSNRIAFEAPPELGEGVKRLPDEIITQAGETLSAPLDAPDVTALIEAEKERTAAERAEIRKDYIRRKGIEVAAKQKVTIAEGQKIVREFLAQDGGQVDVPADMLVYDRNGGVVAAEALVKSVRKGDQFSLPDPMEGPSYGRTTATLMWGLKYDAPILVSHAHGAKTIYRLPAPPSKAIWKIKPAKLKDRRHDTLVEVLGKVASLDDLDKVLAVAVALSNKVPHVMDGRDVMPFVTDHLPDGIISQEWIAAIEGRIKWSVNVRRKQALASSRFSGEILGKPWVDHHVVTELSPLARIDGVTVIRAPMSKGKTQRVGAPWVQAAKDSEFGAEVWAIAHRVSLIGELAQRLDLAHYQRDGYQDTFDKGGCAICLPSITLKKYALQQPDYIFVDEIRQVLEFLGAKDYCRTQEGTAADVFHRLVEIIRNAKGVLVADAGADDTVLRFLRMCRPDDQVRVVEMHDTPTKIKGTVMTGEHCQDAVVDQATFAMEMGAKVWFACEGAEKTAAVAKVLAKHGKVLAIDSDTKQDPAQAAFLADPEGQSRNYDAVVASPIISSGISIEHRDGAHFSAGFGLFSGGAIRPADAAQMLRRVRYITDWTIGLTSLNRFGGRRAEDVIEGKFAAADVEGLAVQVDDFDKLVVGFQAEDHNQRGDFGAGLVWLLRSAGWTISLAEDEGNGDVSDAQKVVRRQRDRKLIQASRWLVTAYERVGEVRIAELVDKHRREHPSRLMRRIIDAWDVMDVVGLRKLEQDDLDWWRDGGRAAAQRYTDLLCRREALEVDDVTLAHRALRKARRQHYVEMLGDWNPLADDAQIIDDVAQRALDVIWPRHKEFAASGAVPETWREMKNKPTNAKAAIRNVLLRCGLWFERKQMRCHRFQDTEIYGCGKSGDSKRQWIWCQDVLALARVRKRYSDLQDRDAQRQRALVVASEQTDQATFKTLKAGLDVIEARKRADDAADEAIKRLESIVKKTGYRPKVTVRDVESPVYVAGQIPVRGMLDALERRGWPVELVND